MNETSAGAISDVFTKTVKFIQDALETVRYNNEQIRKLKEQHQTATLNEQESSNSLSFVTWPTSHRYVEISQELNRILNENSAICKRVKDQMEELNKDVEASKTSAPVNIL